MSAPWSGLGCDAAGRQDRVCFQIYPGAPKWGGAKHKLTQFRIDLPYTWEATGDGTLSWVLVDHLLQSAALRPELRTPASDLWSHCRFGLLELRDFVHEHGRETLDQLLRETIADPVGKEVRVQRAIGAILVKKSFTGTLACSDFWANCHQIAVTVAQSERSQSMPAGSRAKAEGGPATNPAALGRSASVPKASGVKRDHEWDTPDMQQPQPKAAAVAAGGG
eukprot:4947733-Alexandrium_andersonii.AAC.1